MEKSKGEYCKTMDAVLFKRKQFGSLRNRFHRIDFTLSMQLTI